MFVLINPHAGAFSERAKERQPRRLEQCRGNARGRVHKQTDTYKDKNPTHYRKAVCFWAFFSGSVTLVFVIASQKRV